MRRNRQRSKGESGVAHFGIGLFVGTRIVALYIY